MMKAIRLVENLRARAILEQEPRYDVMLYGKKFFQLYFNMRGYTGYLPVPPETPEGKVLCLTLGEGGISRFKKEVPVLNREWEEFKKNNPEWEPTVENGGIRKD